MEGALSSLYPCVDAMGATFPIAPSQPPPQVAPCCQLRCSALRVLLDLCKCDEARPSPLMFPGIVVGSRGRGEAQGQSGLWLELGKGEGLRGFALIESANVMTIGLQSLSSYANIHFENN